MEMEKFYVAPEVEVLEVNIERGYAGSITTGGEGPSGQKDPMEDLWAD